MPTPSSDNLIFVLPHGIQLTVWKNVGNLGIRDVAGFLAEALKYFKQYGAESGDGLYDENGYCTTIKRARKNLGSIVLSRQDHTKLPVGLWREAVVEAYTNANSIEQMLDDLPTWRQATEQDGGRLREIVEMLDMPDGDLLAFAAMFERKRTG